jgi:hypothetical protein
MTESLRTVRIAAAWIMVIYVGATEALSIPTFAALADANGVLIAAENAFRVSVAFLLLPGVAVALTGIVAPPAGAARPLALIGFFEYGIALLWSGVELAASPGRQGIPVGPSVPVAMLVEGMGMAALSAVGAVLCWRVFVALDTLPEEITDIQRQLDELTAARWWACPPKPS